MVNIGMVGVGSISGIYLENITKVFRDVRLVAVCDLIRERAENAQEKYAVPKLYDTMEELFADPEIDVVLNLTRPAEHYAVTRGALLAGKHVYSEKPLTVTYELGCELVALAEEKGLMLGGAPDTFLGAGIQTCRRLIDDGVIGRPIGASAAMLSRGCENWHPDPEFHYKKGDGPMMDMGPYYVTALVNLLGGVRTVQGVARMNFPQRVATCREHYGEVIDVETDTFLTGILGFESGATATLTTTFDVYSPEQARFEVYGERGTLFVPDPNMFGGPVRVFLPEDGEVREVPLMYDYQGNSRGLGLADFCRSLETGRSCRVDYHQTLHVLEILTAFKKSSDARAEIRLQTRYDRRAPMQLNPLHGFLD